MRPTPLRMLSASPRVLWNHKTLYFSRSVLSRSRANEKSPASTATALPFIRVMSSSSTSTKHLFAVHAPDYTDSGVLERRVSVREKHLKGIEGMTDTGTISTYTLPHYILVPMTIRNYVQNLGEPFQHQSLLTRVVGKR
jgi:hypothetical protein